MTWWKRGAAFVALTAGLAAPAACSRSELPLPKLFVPPECVVRDSAAELAPLDAFVMLDSSGSMSEQTPSGGTKWQAVRNAIVTFLVEPQSAGISVGLSFFPIVDESVPETCADDATCGVPGLCDPQNICWPSSTELCDDDSDCSDGADSCVPLGTCSLDESVLCVPGQVDCGSGLGSCESFGFCENRFTCESGPYETPVVPLNPLPNINSPIIPALDQQTPDGGTPTLPALTGAIAQATAHAQDNPGHNVIVVLATDGLPTVCDPALDDPDPGAAIDTLVAAAAEGAQAGVQTYVIGVFSPEEQAEASVNLDAIAAGGGTESAFIITTAEEVADQFLEALNTVRLTEASCEFELDLGAEDVNYEEVYVRLSPESGPPIFVPLVEGADACDPLTGGFFYDVPLSSGMTPTRVQLCPSTCAMLGNSVDRKVEIYTVCDPT